MYCSKNCIDKDSNIYIQSGAGIVADSNVDSEFKETENKALALLVRRNMQIILNK